MMESGNGLAETAEGIRTMEIRGAAEIGRRAALALAEVIERHSDDDTLWEHALAAARILANTRPTAVSLRNALNEVLGAVHGAPDQPREQGRAAAEAFARRVDAAQAAIARHVLPMLQERPRVLTHCHSTGVVNALGHAHDEGVAVAAVVTETRPWRQGRLTARALAGRGVPVRFVVDSAMAWVARNDMVDQVLVGADAITMDGTLYNKIGTSHAALVARDAGLPMHALAERYKFSPYPTTEVEQRGVEEVVEPGTLPLGVDVVNPVFDATPVEHLSGIVTDDGLVAPGEVDAYISRHYGGQEPWI